MNELKRRDFHVLEDSPASDDAFGSHKRIANAILRLVSLEKGGKAIALVGNWGSGKSTVVKQIQLGSVEAGKRHEAKSELAVFSFDAWVHEGDPLRRSFLESLIRFLQEKRWIEKKKWNEKLEQLAQRQKVTTSTSSPVLKGIAAIFVLLVYAAPLGLFFMADHDKFYYQKSVVGAGFTLYFLPVLAIGLYMLWNLAKLSDSDGNYNLLALLANKTTENVKSQTFEYPDPTSLEFEQVFREALDDALEPSRRLLIVIDNLDRVEFHEALKMWSTIHLFVDLSSHRSPAWAERFWTLVPFDEDGITRLWKTNDGVQVGQTFLDKTFQIRFHVPAFVLSDWRSFMVEQLRIAFPEHDENDFYKISHIYGILRTINSPPTPREIKTFINQVGSFYQSSPEVTALPLLALYVALRAQEWGPETQLTDAQNYKLQPYLDADWQETLASVHYNVPKERVAQALFGDKVERCLVEGDATSLEELATKPGVDLVVEQILDRRLGQWSQTQAVTLGHAAFALGRSSIRNTFTWEGVWKRLLSEVKNVKTWPALDKSGGIGLGLLIRRKNDDQFSRDLLHSISSSKPVSTGKPAGNDDEMHRWIAGALEVLGSAITMGQESVARDAFALGDSGLEYVNLLGSTVPINDDPAISTFLRPRCAEADVINDLAAAVKSTSLSPLNEKGMAIMIRTGIAWNWNPIIMAMNLRLHEQNIPPQQIGSYVRSLIRIGRQDPGANQILQQHAQNGWVFHHLHSANQQNEVDSVSSLVLAAIVYNPEATASTNTQFAPQLRTTYLNLVKTLQGKLGLRELLISQTIDLSLVEELISREPSAKLPKLVIREILTGIAEAANSAWFFPPNCIVVNYAILKDVIGTELLEKLTASSLKERDLLGAVTKQPFSVDRTEFYRDLLATAEMPPLVEYCKAGLANVTKDEWATDINAGGALAALALLLKKQNVHLNLGHPLRDALNTVVDEALAGRAPQGNGADDSQQLYETLSAAQQELFRRHLRDGLIGATSSTATLLQVFGSLLHDCKSIGADAERIVRECFAKMLDRKDPIEIQWMSRILRECPDISSRCGTEVLTDLKERVQKFKLDELSEPLKTLMLDIRQTLGLHGGQ